MTARRQRRLLVAPAVTLAVLALALGGCGAEDGDGDGGAGGDPPGAGGTLTWALDSRPAELDPLLATTRAEQLVTRQIHPPLVEQLAGPFGATRRLPGLVVAARPSSDATIWRLWLRPGVRFQDGTPFDAQAVIANLERWSALAEGRAQLPELAGFDAPRPDLVRLILNEPWPELPETLASPRLGIVSPRALRDGLLARGAERSGTGPFELREREPQRVLLARNVNWWGTVRELGPALDQVEFVTVSEADQRLALLADGEAQVAEALGPAQLEALERDPLLVAVPGSEPPGIGAERSVRGIGGATEIPSLSGVWLTTLDSG